MRTNVKTSPWNKGKKLPVEILTNEEVGKLILACSNRAPTGIRNRALIVCLWRCGLRVSEALALRPKDIDSKAGTIRVLHGKGNKARVCGIDPQALAVIQRWLDRRAELGITGRSPVFCTLDGSGIASVYVRNLLRRLGAKCGLLKRVHPHGLRHTHASELRQEGIDIGIICRQLGHANTAVTARYLDHVCPKSVVETMQNRVW
jgi:site-specific recombinase XerD